MMKVPKELITCLKKAERIAVLTGAGISAESGVPTFRDKDGLWSKFRPEELASMEGFLGNPDLVWQWYSHRREILSKVEPNPGHHALVEIEKRAKSFTLITQNVDGLHSAAGNQRVLELHGNIQRNYCKDCQTPIDEPDLSPETVPKCEKCSGLIRPGVVWFGESLPVEVFEEAVEASERSDLFFSIGTSAAVYPAASLPALAKRQGAMVVEINPHETELTGIVDFFLMEKSGEILPKIVEETWG